MSLSSIITKGLRQRLADTSGVAALVVAAAIAIVAFTALSIFLNKYIGDRTFERFKGANAGCASSKHLGQIGA